MKEQDINFTENAFAHNTGIKSRQCDPSKTSFFHLDKNYCPREYDKVNKVLRPSQTGNISGHELDPVSIMCWARDSIQSSYTRYGENFRRGINRGSFTS